ncbi:M48 family metallopeptidase [Thiomicrorhabdus hydrogeniphila]
MNFYSAQENAKKKTKYLVLLYILVLIALTFLSTVVLMFIVPMFTGQTIHLNHFWDSIYNERNLPTFLWVGAFILSGALISSIMKARHLSNGGAVIAASLGGVRLSSNSHVLNERKALNVVEEMAIASGMPVPEVFILRKENAINAFAAGQTPQDAVIGLTQGCIDKLTRAQLQGVVGHEFSHILNGDMRLNLRIIMLLYGIEFISLLGRILSSTSRRGSSRKGKGNGAIILVGIALRIIGWFGILFGNMIQGAVSRQREFLADASSVQFTRDPTTIADALKVIGGGAQTSRLKNTDVNDVAHMFFGQAFNARLAFLFATHPPIELRIQRIEPSWDGAFLKALPPPSPIETPTDSANNSQTSLERLQESLPQPLAMLMAAGVMVDHLSESSQNTLSKLVEKAQDPMEAMALILAILAIEEDQGEDNLTDKDNQDLVPKIDWSSLLKDSNAKGLDGLVKQQIQLLKSTKLVNKLPLVELAMPALKSLSKTQYIEFKGFMQSVMDWDGQQTIFEQSVFQLVGRYLDVNFGLKSANKVRYKKAQQVAMELQMVFSSVVYYGHNTPHDKEENGSKHNEQITMDYAFAKAIKHIGLPNLQRIEVDDKQQAMFQLAVEKLLYCSEPLKQKIIESLVLSIEYDGHVNAIEKELVLAIAATMNAPIPRINCQN